MFDIDNANFDKDGFILLRNVFNKEIVKALIPLIQDIISYAENGLEDPFDRFYLGHRADQGVLYDLFQRHPEFSELVREPKILDKLEKVLGDDIFMYENSLVYKPPGKLNGVPWHQDFISRPNEPRKFIAWMALDNVTRNTGALKVVPGSHKMGFLPWHRIKGEAHHDRLNIDSIDTNNSIHVELEPGDVLIFNQLLVHSSDEMNTDCLRLVYRASYQGFDEIYTPRGTPIVMRGGRPKNLASKYPAVNTRKKIKSLNIAHKIGRRLSNL